MPEKLSHEYLLEAGRTRFKFDLFMLSLTVSLLGAATQTAELDRRYWTTYVELLGWALLAAAAVASVLRLEWFAPEQELESKKARADEDLYTVTVNAQGSDHALSHRTGEIKTMEEVAQERRISLRALDNRLHDLNERQGRLYLCFRWLLFAGFAALLVARAAVVFVRS